MIKNFTIRTSIMLALLLATCTLHAQQKMSVGLLQKLHETKTAQKSQRAGQEQQNIQLFVAGDAAEITATVAQLGGTVLISTSNILSVEIPSDKVGELSANSSVERIEIGQRYKLLNNESKKHMGVDKIQAGNLPNGIRYDGEGVIVGIIDSGIDFRHPDFCNPTDKTKSRVLYLWDQTATGTSTDYKYGKEYTQDQINKNIAGTASDITHKDKNGHGTHVAGTAAGNGSAISNYGGMAPKADLIIVGLDFAKDGGIADAADYIFKKAQALNKPCVINMSIGSHFGPHDGTSLEEQLLSNLVTEKEGRAIIAAAGNENGSTIHWGNLNLTADSVWHYRTTDPNLALDGEELSIAMYGTVSNANAANVFMSIGADSLILQSENVTGAVKQAQTPWLSIASINATDQYWEGNLTYKNKQIASVKIYTNSISSTKSEFAIIINDIVQISGSDIIGHNTFRMIFKGEGTIHTWTEDSPTFEQGSPITTSASYRFADNNYIVGSPASSNNVIAVGAFANMKYFKNKDGDNIGYNTMIVGEIAEFSSVGPTVDGRTKPEITAPGHNVVSVLSKDCGADPMGIAWGGKHQTMSGTSMACPNVTGCIALYLQRYPKATIAEIRDAVIKNAKTDMFTGITIPNNTWGYGKINIFAMMQSTTGVETTANDAFMVKSYPNPFSELTTVEFFAEQPEAFSIKLYDISGKLVKSVYQNTIANQGMNSFTLNAENISNGIYFLSISNGRNSSTTKICVSK